MNINRSVLIYVALSGCFLTDPHPCQGEILLDDFSQGFALYVPKELLVEQERLSDRQWGLDVGDLKLRRHAGILDFRTPDATLTFNTGPRRTHIATIDALDVPPSSGFSNFQLSYDYVYPDQECRTCLTSRGEPFDVTEKGQNDAVFVDFAFVQGPTPPRVIRMDAFTAGDRGFSYILDIAPSEDPFTVVVPFSDFRNLGNGLAPDFSTVGALVLNVFTSGLYTALDSGIRESFSLGIDSIRFGQLDPLDFNLDDELDIDDLDLLLSHGPLANGGVPVVVGENDRFDLNGEGTIDLTDVELWLSQAAERNGFSAPYLYGDSNLDGIVDARDLNALGGHWLDTTTSWSMGDFNGDGLVSVGDLDEIGRNWLQVTSENVSVSSPMVIPEPTSISFWMIGITWFAHRRSNVTNDPT